MAVKPWKTLPPMLPENDLLEFLQRTPRDEIWWSGKADGVHCRAVVEGDTPESVSFWSRSGWQFKGLDHLRTRVLAVAEQCALRSVFPDGPLVFDGELVGEGAHRDLLSSLNRHEHATYNAQLYLFDVCSGLPRTKEQGPIFSPLWLRLVWLEEAVMGTRGIGSKISVLPHFPLIESSLREVVEQALAQGFEGVVLKRKSGAYCYGQSPQWCKCVPEETLDLQVVGSALGRDGIAHLVCELPGICGEQVAVGTGFTRAQRREFAAELPGMIEVSRRKARTGGTVPPYVFRRVRDDKCPAA